MNEQKMKSLIEKETGINVLWIAQYYNGFSFIVGTELEAYKAAYIYRYNRDVKIKQAACPVGKYLVQVYN